MVHFCSYSVWHSCSYFVEHSCSYSVWHFWSYLVSHFCSGTWWHFSSGTDSVLGTYVKNELDICIEKFWQFSLHKTKNLAIIIFRKVLLNYLNSTNLDCVAFLSGNIVNFIIINSIALIIVLSVTLLLNKTK